jgi:hypothetical protein
VSFNGCPQRSAFRSSFPTTQNYQSSTSSMAHPSGAKKWPTGDSKSFLIVAIFCRVGHMQDGDANLRREMIRRSLPRAVQGRQERKKVNCGVFMLLPPLRRYGLNWLPVSRDLFAIQICPCIRRRSRRRGIFATPVFTTGFNSDNQRSLHFGLYSIANGSTQRRS